MTCPGQVPESSEEHIQILSDLEAIRLRPGMYLGSTDLRGLHHLLFDLVTESLAEAVAGYGQSVRVTLRADNSAEVADDSRGLPVINSPDGGSSVEEVFTRLHGFHGRYCPYPDGRDYWHYAVLNALSEWARVSARSAGSVYQHTFRAGATHTVLQSGGPPGDRGLTVAFRPDPLIFGDARFDPDTIRDRLREFAFLHSGVQLSFTDETTGTHDEFEYADGVREYVQFLNADRRPLHPDPILIRGEEHGVRYDIGLQWCEGEVEELRAFANHYFTLHGGTHLHGFHSGVAAGLLDFIREQGLLSGELRAEDLRSGLTAVVSVWLREPQFSGALRTGLNNPEVEAIVKAVVRQGLCDYFEANREVGERVARTADAARAARVAHRAERDRQRRTSE